VAGANVSPIGVINQIASNLSDRYENGFPVLKEIIQNSDDANADRLVIGWSTGIENPVNPLLADPGLFFINNAPLEEVHERGIRSIAESSKVSSKSSVGKFGLGMKSLFHLCEAFFYQANNWREDKWAGEVFNPWGEDYRPDWHDFSDEDKLKLEEKLCEVLAQFKQNTDSPWFIVWVPLRNKKQEASVDNDVIISNFYEDHTAPDFLLDSNLPGQVAEIFPLLKNLLHVDLVVEQDTKFTRLFDVSIEIDATRSQFEGSKSFSFGKQESTCCGKVTITQQSGESEIFYAGFEKLLQLEQLSGLKSVDSGWPVSYQFDSSTNRPKKSLDKAEQHAAVIISRTRTNNQAYIRANWAVFLPLADTPEFTMQAINGEFDYSIHIHGYFFVDAGRKGIIGHDGIGKNADFSSIKGDEKLLREAWNITLANEGSLDILLDALEHFVKSQGLSKGEIENINRGVCRILPDAYINRVTTRKQWVYRLQEKNSAWLKTSSKNKYRCIPCPPSNDYKRIWEILPTLNRLGSDEYVLVEQDKPNIIARGLARWQFNELRELLNLNVNALYGSSTHLEYLNKFIETATWDFQQSDVDQLIKPIICNSLMNVELTVLSSRKKLFQQLLSKLSSANRIALPISKNDTVLWGALLKTELNTLLIPAFLESSDNKSSGKLSVGESITLLEVMDKILRDEITTVSDSKSAEILVSFILQKIKESSQQDLEEVYRCCSRLRLFKADNIATKRPILMSLVELQEANVRHQLYVRSAGPSYGEGEKLVKATSGFDVLFIQKDKAAFLFGEQVIPECQGSFVLSALAKNQPDLTDEYSRKSLLLSLSGFTKLHNEQKQGFRYLLHGSIEDDLTFKLWKKAPSAKDVWAKLWRLSSNIDSPKWCLISDSLGGALNDELKIVLNVHEISAEGVLSQLENEICGIDYSSDDFTQEDFDEILCQVKLPELWKKLPLHLTTEQARTIIDNRCLLEGRYQLPELQLTQIKRSNHPDVEEQQKKWIGVATPEKLIRVAVSQDNPENYTSFILKQLTEVKSIYKDLDSELIDLIKKTKWLKLISDVSVSPLQVIDIDSNNWPQTGILCDRDDTDCFSIEQLTYSVSSNQDFKRSLKPFVHTPKKSSNFIFSTAGNITSYSLGKIDGLTFESLNESAQSNTLLNELPGLNLLVEYFDNIGSDFDLVSAMFLAHALPEEKLIQALEIIADEERPTQMENVRNTFLSALAKSDDAHENIKNIRLRTKSGTYRISTELTHNVTEVNADYLVHDSEFKLLESALTNSYSGCSTQVENDNQSLRTFPVDVLKEYFEPWERHVPQDSIAIFLSLMCGDEDIATYVDQLYRNRTYKGVIDTLSAKWDSRAPGPYSGYKFGSLIKSIRLVPSIIDSNVGVATSIFGIDINVELNQKVRSIAVVQKLQGSKKHKIQLRTIHPQNFERSQLLKLLQDSAELIISEIFGQSIRLNELWKEIGSTNQLDIKLAKRMVLEKIVPTLERLRIKKHGVGLLLSQYSQAQRYYIESPQNGRAEIDSVLSNIQQLIEKDDELKLVILDSVRHEIGYHSQYFPDSVPFELFQNADDAIGEKILMEGGCLEEFANPKYTVNFDQETNSIDFFHWGREINYCKVGYSEGEGRYERDLEKMVSLNISDKTGTSTGKFGLGFKSCLLICDEPEIYSGDISFNIQAGILPIASPSIKTLENIVESHVSKGALPTLTRLKLTSEYQSHQDEILARFKQSAGILCVFSNHITTIEINNERIQWTGKPISKIEGLYIGETKIPSGGKLKSQKILHFRSKKGQFIFQLRRDGFISLEGNELSKFWVLNPLQEDLPAGFIVESDFQVDIGRSQLAKNNDANINVMADIGRNLASMLKSLYLWSQDDWEDCKLAFGLTDQLTKEKFWGSLWNVLTTGWPKALSNTESKAILFRELFIATGGLLTFYNNHFAVPTSISKGNEGLISLENVSCQADKLLTSAYKNLCNMPNLQSLVNENKLVNYSVGQFLEQIKHGYNSISVVDLIKDYIPEGKTEPEAAEVLGKLFNSNFDLEMSKYQANYSETEILKRELKNILFLSKSDRWIDANSVFIFNEKSSDSEKLIAKFAPSHGLLSEGYSHLGQIFFDFCQTRPNLNTFEWAIAIHRNDEERQLALLKYLISPDGARLLQRLKNKPPEWMVHPNLDPAILKSKWKFTDLEVERFHVQWTDTDEDLRKRGQQRVKNESVSQYSPDLALMNVHEWWLENKHIEQPKYDDKLYYKPLPWQVMADDVELKTLEARRGWLQLFYLGSCQTMGRTTEGHHREAMRWFSDKGWWDKIASPEGVSANEWTDIIDEYLDSSMVEERYRQWFQILPLYRFSVHLDDYVELFLQADRIENIDDLVKTSSSAALQGSGISLPELKATLGIGVNFVIRELIRHGVVDPEAAKFAFSLSNSARQAISKVGYQCVNNATPYESQNVYSYFESELGPKDATFDLSFDIPFRIIWGRGNDDLRESLLGVGAYDFEEEFDIDG
jgi:hypothetical protein